MSKRITYKVEGDVQGVNYRSFAVQKANGLNITGWAKNESDGTVGGEAQGDASSIDKFVEHLRMGPSAAKVSKVDHSDIETKNSDNGFER
ncbi:Acylphosphatase [Teratosphaeria nubilosa]|uniref:acylphosphatase n=1 Tax=Teratosphaeria nubilosa TaxID=161662 RepID=A0A6G1L7R5_9PEZI|nr:Acylphosphatase [Teratosphaeria nubilosa]